MFGKVENLGVNQIEYLIRIEESGIWVMSNLVFTTVRGRWGMERLKGWEEEIMSETIMSLRIIITQGSPVY